MKSCHSMDLTMPLGITMLALLALWTAAVAAKPQSPVRVEIRAETADGRGEARQFRVTARSRVAAARFDLRVRLPDGAVLEQGRLRWQGALAAGEACQVRFRLRPGPDPEAALTAVAEAVLANGSRFGAQALHPLHKRLPSRPARLSPALRLLPGIAEYPPR